MKEISLLLPLHRGADLFSSLHLLSLCLSGSGAVLSLPSEGPKECPCGHNKGKDGARDGARQAAYGVPATKRPPSTGQGAVRKNEDHWLQQGDGLFQPGGSTENKSKLSLQAATIIMLS